jgi:cyanoexosortase A
MGADSAGVAPGRWLMAAAIFVATCHLVLSGRLDADDYWVTLTAAWLAALYLAWQRRAETLSILASARVAPVWAIAGGAPVVATIVALAAVPEYRAWDRILPLVAAGGLLIAGFGLRGLPAGLRHYRREITVLALPMVNPPLNALRELVVSPLMTWTAWTATAIHHVIGTPASVDGTRITALNATVDVYPPCSGALGITRLWVLAALVIALFPTTLRQKVSLFFSAILVGFFLNAVRVAFLVSVAMRGDDDKFTWWHIGPGSNVFSIASTAAAGLLFWLTLREWRADPKPMTTEPNPPLSIRNRA